MNYSRKREASFFVLLSMFLSNLCGCSILKQYGQMATFSKCEFRLESVEGTTLGGIPIQGVTQVSDLGFVNLAKLQTLLSGGTLPLEFTLNIEVKNPNSSVAAMNKLAWILYLDDNE